MSTLFFFVLAIIFQSTIFGIIIDQEILLDNNFTDIGVTYSLSIDGLSETMTLTMSGPENRWMGVILGKQNMFNATAYVYYLDNENQDQNPNQTNQWILTERYLRNEQNAGDLIDIIDPIFYNTTTQDGITTITFIRSFFGRTNLSYTLSQDSLDLEYGFALGTSPTLGYHGRDGRSHSIKPLSHLCCECTDESCDVDPACLDITCSEFDNRCCNPNQGWREQCNQFATQRCLLTAPIGIKPPCCACLQPSRRGNNGIRGCELDPRCEDIICGDIGGDPFCCGAGGFNGDEGSWDNICVSQANAVCNDEPLPKCCSCIVIGNNFDQDIVGCDLDKECQEAICGQDPFCCGVGGQDGLSGFWDGICAQTANSICIGLQELPEPVPNTPGPVIQNTETLQPNIPV